MIADHYPRTGSGLMAFYTFGQISQTEGVPYIYNLEERQKLHEEIVGHAVTLHFLRTSTLNCAPCGCAAAIVRVFIVYGERSLFHPDR